MLDHFHPRAFGDIHRRVVRPSAHPALSAGRERGLGNADARVVENVIVPGSGSLPATASHPAKPSFSRPGFAGRLSSNSASKNLVSPMLCALSIPPAGTKYVARALTGNGIISRPPGDCAPTFAPDRMNST